MPRNQQNDTERHKEVNQWILVAPGKKCRFDTHLDGAFFFHWSNVHAGHAYKGFAKYCAYKLRKVGDKSRLRAVSLLLENLWVIAIYVWVLIYPTRSPIFEQNRDCSKSNLQYIQLEGEIITGLVGAKFR